MVSEVNLFIVFGMENPLTCMPFEQSNIYLSVMGIPILSLVSPIIDDFLGQ